MLIVSFIQNLAETAAEFKQGISDILALDFGRAEFKINAVFEATLYHAIFDGLTLLLFVEMRISNKNS